MLPPTNPYGHIDPEKDFISFSDAMRSIGKSPSNASVYVENHKVPTITVAGRRVLWRYVWEAHVKKLREQGKLPTVLSEAA